MKIYMITPLASPLYIIYQIIFEVMIFTYNSGQYYIIDNILLFIVLFAEIVLRNTFYYENNVDIQLMKFLSHTLLSYELSKFLINIIYILYSYIFYFGLIDTLLFIYLSTITIIHSTDYSEIYEYVIETIFSIYQLFNVKYRSHIINIYHDIIYQLVIFNTERGDNIYTQSVVNRIKNYVTHIKVLYD